MFCNGDGPACTSHPVATLLRLWKDGSWHHQHQWRTMRRMLLRLRKDGYRHHPHHRLKFSMGLLGRGFYASPSPGSSWNDTGDSPSPLLWAAILDWCSVMMASVSPTFSPGAVFFSSNSLVDVSLTKNSSNNCWCSSINSFRKEVSSIDLGGGCRG